MLQVKLGKQSSRHPLQATAQLADDAQLDAQTALSHTLVRFLAAGF